MKIQITGWSSCDVGGVVMMIRVLRLYFWIISLERVSDNSVCHKTITLDYDYDDDDVKDNDNDYDDDNDDNSEKKSQ